eukprot:6383290-Prymnesium_polylepis.1
MGRCLSGDAVFGTVRAVRTISSSGRGWVACTERSCVCASLLPPNIRSSKSHSLPSPLLQSPSPFVCSSHSHAACRLSASFHEPSRRRMTTTTTRPHPHTPSLQATCNLFIQPVLLPMCPPSHFAAHRPSTAHRPKWITKWKEHLEQPTQ